MFKTIREDIQTVFKKDPAAKALREVLFCYPGVHAIWLHRIARWFYNNRLYVTARFISHFNRQITGIEIHPGARIGKRIFIDHGMGVVIGETADVGDDVLIYQGVVLGGTSFEKIKRHPSIGNNVVIGAGAIVLGAVNVGDNARIGAGSVVINDVPSNATAVGVPGRIGVDLTQQQIQALEHGKLPDPIADAIRFVMKEQEQIEKRLTKVESLEGVMVHIDERIEKKKKEIEKAFMTRKEDAFIDGDGI